MDHIKRGYTDLSSPCRALNHSGATGRGPVRIRTAGCDGIDFHAGETPAVLHHGCAKTLPQHALGFVAICLEASCTEPLLRKMLYCRRCPDQAGKIESGSQAGWSERRIWSVNHSLFISLCSVAGKMPGLLLLGLQPAIYEDGIICSKSNQL